MPVFPLSREWLRVKWFFAFVGTFNWTSLQIFPPPQSLSLFVIANSFIVKQSLFIHSFPPQPSSSSPPLPSYPRKRVSYLIHNKIPSFEGMTQPIIISFTHAREIDICDLYVFLSTLEKYVRKTRRETHQHKILSERCFASRVYFVPVASRRFTHIFRKSWLFLSLFLLCQDKRNNTTSLRFKLRRQFDQ
jgi:hypothetical protein